MVKKSSFIYLKIIINGEEPWFDKANNKWISKTEYEEKKNQANATANQGIANAEAKFKQNTPQPQVTPQVQQPDNKLMDSIMLPDDEEDLPF